MSDSFEVLAPGKLVLVGEYAVLLGGPAIAAAIDRGVRCVVTTDPSLESVEVQVPGGDDRFVRGALEHALPARYHFMTWNPALLPGGHKPGFGGSAAACVAACIAAGRPVDDAYALHRSAQGGGSGIDVAATIHGGMIRFEPGEPPSIAAMEPVVPVVVWSGRSAKTGPRVDAFLQWASAHRSEAAGFAAVSRQAVDAFQSEPLAAMALAGENLETTLTRAGVDYMTAGLRRISELARRFGGAAKPSGAGGGDCAVALFAHDTAAIAFAEECAAQGFTIIPVHVADGAGRVEQGDA